MKELSAAQMEWGRRWLGHRVGQDWEMVQAHVNALPAETVSVLVRFFDQAWPDGCQGFAAVVQALCVERALVLFVEQFEV